MTVTNMMKRFVDDSLILKSARDTFLVCALVCTCLLTSKVFASEDQLEDWFQIEVLVFAQKPIMSDDEQWPELNLQYPSDMLSIAPVSREELRPENLWQLNELLEYEALQLRKDTIEEPSRTEGLWLELLAAFSGEDLDMPEALVNLPVESRNLNKAAIRLEQSPQYRILHHISWRQPMKRKGATTSVLIQAGQQYEDFFELNGTLTFSRSRYVHIDADLWFTEFARYEDADEQREIRESIILEDEVMNQLLSNHPDIRQLELDKNQFVPHQIYRLQESRRLRNKEANYLDHPAFGILIRVNTYEPESDDEGDGELP